MRLNRLSKSVLALVLPLILTALLAIQVFFCRKIFELRNSYLLESLPPTSEKVWDALSGNLYPHLDHSVEDQSVLAHYKARPLLGSTGNGIPASKEQWQQELHHFRRHYRESVLQSGLPSLTVHYLWCVDGFFELNQYITIMSLLHQLRPDKIIIHYRVKPRSDPHGYWRWLEDLERDIVMLSLKPMKYAQYCSNDLSSGINLKQFPDPHGVFILGDVVVTNLTRPDIVHLMTKSFSAPEKGIQPSQQLSQSKVFLVSQTEPYHVSQSPGRVVLTCPTDTYFNKAQNDSSVPCVSMQSYISFDELFHLKTRFLNLVRTLMYGSAKPVEITMGTHIQIPSIVHIILEDDKSKVTPLLYLSIKSAFITGKVDRVFVHCHNKPTGELWERLILSDHLEPKYIPTSSMKTSNSKQAINSYLLYTLLQHGGVATLGDVIFLKSVSSMPLRASAISTLQKSHYRQRHRSLNTAILAASPGSDFVKYVLGMIYQPKPSNIETSLNEIATHASEINPKSVFIDTLLTAHQICDGSKCMIAGGHDSPNRAYTTRLLWSNNDDKPGSLHEFLNLEGPIRPFFQKLV